MSNKVLIDLGDREILVNVDDGVSMDELSQVIREQFDRPIDPIKFDPVKIDIPSRIEFDPIKVQSDVRALVSIPDVDRVLDSVRESHAQTSQAIEQIGKSLKTKTQVSFPSPCGWECEVIRNRDGFIQKLKFSPVDQ